MSKEVGKKSPSRERYDKGHPPVSFRLPLELRARLEKIAAEQGLTIGQVIREYLTGFVSSTEELSDAKRAAYEEGRKKGQHEEALRAEWRTRESVSEARHMGYNEARERYELVFPCAVCGRPMSIAPMSPGHLAIARIVEEAGMRHAKCAYRT